jgi:outer membrane protein OmpA-like peptidoglycan-associated protein
MRMATGTEQDNLLLSYRRAKAVAAYLVSAGTEPQRIVIRAAGSHEPIAGLTPEDELNRRVTLQLAGLPGCPDEAEAERHPLTAHRAAR